MNRQDQRAGSGDASLWRDTAMYRFGFDEMRRLAAFVVSEAGPVLKVYEIKDVLEADPEACLGYAAVANARALSKDVVGSLLFLAARRDGAPALAMFAGALADAILADLSATEEDKTEFRLQRRRIKAIRHAWERLVGTSALQDFRSLTVSIETTAVALRGALDTDDARRNRELRGNFKIVAPHLKQVGHLGEGAKPCLALAKALPMWRAMTPVEVLRTVLELEYSHAADAAAAVAEAVAGSSDYHERPLVLVGRAGTGKDSLVRRAAEIVGRPAREFDLAGSSDSRLLRGTAKGWSSACPSFPVSVIVETKVANPLIQFSELEKAGGERRNGVVFDTLLGWAEPTSARKWFDEGLASSVDLSGVCMIFTANTLDGVPVPLRTRLRVVEVPPPRPHDVEALFARARERHARARGLDVGEVPELQPAGLAILKRDAGLGRLNLRTIDRVAKTVVAGTDPALLRVHH